MDTDDRADAPGTGPGRDRSPHHAAESLGRLRARPRRRDRRARAPPGRPAARTPRSRHSRAAGDRARGATAYVTLEPCAHHGRTRPCTDALVDGRRRPGRRRGRGPRPARRRSGHRPAPRARASTVDVGIGADAAARLARAVPLHRRAGRAFVVLKTAMSLDGRTAARRRHLAVDHRGRGRAPTRTALRAESQAVVVGAGTALADRPRLTARDAEDPRRAPAAARRCSTRSGRVPAEGPLFDTELAPTLVVTTDAAPDAVASAWQAAGAKVRRVPPAASGVGVDLARGARAARRPRGAAGDGRGWRALAGVVRRRGTRRPARHLRRADAARRRRPPRDRLRRARDASPTPPGWQLVDVTRFGADVRLVYEPPREAGTVPDVHRHRRGAGPVRGDRPRTPAARASRSRPTRCSTTRRSARRSR